MKSLLYVCNPKLKIQNHEVELSRKTINSRNLIYLESESTSAPSTTEDLMIIEEIFLQQKPLMVIEVRAEDRERVVTLCSFMFKKRFRRSRIIETSIW